uniref:Putative myelin transcription factor 1 n=1 Tax=Nyssomyia neivai TaxID=330878 RepID=A0A1L8DHX8_9DIPT
MEHVNEKSSLTSSGSDHEVMDSWTFVDESRNSGQQQPETSGNVKVEEEESQPPNTETKTDKYHLSVDQDNDTELSDGISIISDSDCGGRHSPDAPPKETHSRSTDTSFIPPAEIPLSHDKRLIEVDKRLVEQEEEADLVRGIFGISRRHVVFVVLLAGISGAMFGHIFRMNPGPPCDCTKLIEPLMNRVYDLEVENFRLRDEVTKLTKQILSDLTTPTNPSTNPHDTLTPHEPQEENLWDTLEATVKPLIDESICGSDTGEELFDDYYGKLCREAENRVKEARKIIEDEPQKTPWKAEINTPAQEEKKQERKFDERKKEKKYPEKDEWKNSKERNTKEKRKDYRESREKDFGKNSKERDYKKNSRDERDSKEDKREFKKNSHENDNSKEDRRDYKKDSRERNYKKNSHEDDDSKEDKRGSREDRRNSKERFDERRKKDDDWSGEEYRKREKSEKMKKGERKDYDNFKDSRERKYEKKNGKKWDDDDDDDSREKFDKEWHEKRMQGREEFRDKESDENNSNWYLERGSDREIKRLRVEGSRDRRR